MLFRSNIAVVAISDEDQASIAGYAKQVKPAFTLLQDKGQTTQQAWLVSAIPELAVIDPKGIVTFATIGAGTYLDETLAAAEQASSH